MMCLQLSLRRRWLPARPSSVSATPTPDTEQQTSSELRAAVLAVTITKCWCHPSTGAAAEAGSDDDTKLAAS
jgi:hypothetical protein